MNKYQIRVEWREDGVELWWEPENGVDASRGITGPVFVPKGKELILRPHSAGIYMYSAPAEEVKE